MGDFLLATACPCFTPGALIATDTGWTPVEALSVGQKVVTRDNGLRKIAWVGRRDLAYAELQETPRLQPILVRRGSLGPDRPARDMLVSPRHRFLVRTANRGGDETLMAAEHLMDRRGVASATVLGVSYLHLLLDRHEVILANGAWTESFHPDDEVLRVMARRQRDEILALFPEIETVGASRRFPAARDIKSSRFDG